MKTTFRRRGIVLAAALVLLWAVSTADTGGGPASFVGTGWALLPPAVAIVLAFVTKEVYSSLLAGCVMGALLAEGFAPWRSFETLFLTLMEGIDRKIFFFDVLPAAPGPSGSGLPAGCAPAGERKRPRRALDA